MLLRDQIMVLIKKMLKFFQSTLASLQPSRQNFVREYSYATDEAGLPTQRNRYYT